MKMADRNALMRAMLAVERQRNAQQRGMPGQTDVNRLMSMHSGYEPDVYPDAINPVGFTFPQDIAGAVIRQPYTAGEAVGQALYDPSIPSVTNAAFQTGLAVAQPVRALGALGAGYGAAGAVDMFGSSSAEAGDTVGQVEIDPLDPQSRKRLTALQDKANKRGGLSRAEREEQNSYLAIIQAAKTKEAEIRIANTGADQAERARIEREMRERRMKQAETAYQREMDRDLRFADTRVGRLYNSTGGFAAPLAGIGAGMISRAATGPGITPAGKITKDYALPITGGALAGTVVYNGPVAFDAYATPRLNPQREAMMAYVRSAPADDPTRIEYERFLQDETLYPAENPIKTGAKEEIRNDLNSRLLMGALEGASGVMGADIARAIGRAYMGRGGGQSGGPPPTPPPGPPKPPKPRTKRTPTKARATAPKAAPAAGGPGTSPSGGSNAPSQQFSEAMSLNYGAPSVALLPAGVMGGMAASGGFDEALAGFQQAMIDLDGDGVPDAVAPDNLLLGRRY